MPDMNGDPTHDPTPETEGHRLSAGLTIGHRVVVRYRLEPGPGASATDFVGEPVARNNDFLIVDTPKERVKLIRADVIAAKDVPPRAERAGAAHVRVSADDLEKLMADGWPATDRAELGGWLLRAAGGFTGRANSVLPVGDSTLDIARSVDFCERWYAARDLPPLFQLHGPTGFAEADSELGRELLGRGYVPGSGRGDWERIHVMTGASAAVPPLTTESAPVTAEAEIGAEWLMAYGEQRPIVPGVTEAVLSGSPGQLFLSVRDPRTRRIVGVARMAIHVGWAGLFGVWVHPDHRRTGLARAVVSAAAMVARENTMPAMYLQVSADNAAGIAFWEGLGFTTHHEYSYLGRPAA